MQSLEIQDDAGEESTLYDSRSLSADQEKDKADQQVEVHILQSGFSTPTTAASADPAVLYSASCCDGTVSSQSSSGNCSFRRTAQDGHRALEGGRKQLTDSRPYESITSLDVAQDDGTGSSGDAHHSMLASTVTRTRQPIESAQHIVSMNVSTQTIPRPPTQAAPRPPTQAAPQPPIRDHSLLLIRRGQHLDARIHNPITSMPHPSQRLVLHPSDSDKTQTLLPHPSDADKTQSLVPHRSATDGDKMQKLVRRSGRKLSQKSNSTDKTSPKRGAYNLRHKQTPSTDITPPLAKKSKHVDDTAPGLSELEYDNGMDTDPLQWGVDDVIRFISGVPRCNYTEVFREHVSDDTKNKQTNKRVALVSHTCIAGYTNTPDCRVWYYILFQDVKPVYHLFPSFLLWRAFTNTQVTPMNRRKKMVLREDMPKIG